MPTSPCCLRWLLLGLFSLSMAGALCSSDVDHASAAPAPPTETAPANAAGEPTADPPQTVPADQSPELIADAEATNGAKSAGATNAIETTAEPPAPDPTALAVVAALESAQRAQETLAARLAQMESTLAQQRARDQDFLRDITRFALGLAAGLAGIALLALLAIVWLQIRASRQQALFIAQLPAFASAASSFGALPGGTAANSPPHTLARPLPPNPALAAAQERFQSAADRLEKRLLEMEALAAGTEPSTFESDVEPAPGAAATGVPATSPKPAAAAFQRGQTLLAAGDLAGALTCFDEALAAEPDNAHAHLKRGAVLEKLNRLDEAVAAYDAALSADRNLTVAYLAKAGVLNRQQRFDEALEVYERALVLPQQRPARLEPQVA
jgi:tetratricopeptide (TPR) repeat protein